jgi:DNA-binding CsgD family transcriptional regulator
MAEISFSEVETKIPIDEYFRILNWMDKALSVGVEMERPCAASHDVIAQKLDSSQARLSYSRGDGSLVSYKRAGCGKLNVAHVISDGSTHTSTGGDGVEIIFAGTTERFAWIRERLTEIEKVLDRLDCEDYHSSCSNHISVVSVQDRLLPTVVLKNILQITRGFSSGLLWICSAEKNRVSRQGIGHYANVQISYTPLGKPLRQLVGTAKYNLCNMSKQPTFTAGRGSDDIMMAGLFVEFRNPDAIRTPSAVASLMIMYKAIVYRAVELSTKGVLNVDSLHEFDDGADWTMNKRVAMGILSNEMTDEFNAFAKANAKSLVNFITPQLKSISSEALEILNEMAEKPVGLRRRNADATYKTIEKELTGRKNDDALSEKEERLVETVMDGKIRAKTPALYRQEMARKLDVSVRMVEYLMQKVREKTGKAIVYDNEMNRYRIE